MRFLAALSAVCLAIPLAAQSPTYVDSAGVFRWTTSKQEVALFGVNYAAPFAYDYRAIGRLGLNRKAAIDADVAHLARLGVDAFRIHVWDREVSDTLGTLLINEHLDLFDYLLWKLEQRGIKAILTPIAWWGSGYPEPDPAEPGFSARFPKSEMGRNPRALPPQRRYLEQFVAHVNPYTRKAYGADPNIVAFELFNEPHHDGMTAAAITAYINSLVDAARRGGAQQPIFYNITEHFRPEQATAVCGANIQGVSGQWYPTGLVRGAELPQNPLPNVDRYAVPFAGEPLCRDKARMIYEFDAADVLRPVMYPAMARAFRTAGFQWATQFAYDPMAVAYSNTEYQTHFLNLAYTPAKAISLLIAGEAFRRVPRGYDAGTYPTTARFGWPGGEVRLDAAGAGVSELLTDTLFAYAGTTTTTPSSMRTLKHVAGVGSSPVVRYGGSGAYFLDKLAPGVWRLEVMPDAEPVIDPFTYGTLTRAVTRIVHRAQPMTLRLPELAGGVRLRPLNSGNRWQPAGMGTTFTVKPGVYLLTTATAKPSAYTPSRALRGGALGDYYAPAPTADSLVATATAAYRRLTQNDSAREAWSYRVPASAKAVFDAGRDYARVITPGYMEGVRYRSELVPAYNSVPAAWRMAIDDFGGTAWHVAFRAVMPAGLTQTGDTLLITGRSATPVPVQIALVLRDGSAFGTRVTFDSKVTTVRVPLSELSRVPLVLLPRPYPTFQPYDLLSDAMGPLELAQLEGVQFGVAKAEGRVVVEITRVVVK
ncbi:MAG: glycoside hydrolase family 5 protein [Gemmatimonadaceae bacterium]|nr:glycoside hydrolase family 5 protein [Gemmatimonadaceae bacterium]